MAHNHFWPPRHSVVSGRRGERRGTRPARVITALTWAATFGRLPTDSSALPRTTRTTPSSPTITPPSIYALNKLWPIDFHSYTTIDAKAMRIALLL